MSDSVIYEQEAIAFHLEKLKKKAFPIPEPVSFVNILRHNKLKS